MGNYLDKPLTEKATQVFISEEEAGAGDHEKGRALLAVSTSMQGWRCAMEDRVITSKVSFADGGAAYIFGVFDGHGGEEVSEFCRQHMLAILTKETDFLAANGDPERISSSLKTACVKLDMEVKRKLFTSDGLLLRPKKYDPLDMAPGAISPPRGEGKKHNCLPGSVSSFVQGESRGEDLRKSIYAEGDMEFETCGSTSLMTILTARHIITANCGDSRAVLAKQGVSWPLSRDHKPSVPEEQRRIEAAGATVTRGRIGGRLAMSRCIGDHSFKCNPDRAIEEQAVSCVPDVSVFCRKEDEDEFLLLACDGVFDVMSNDEICYTVRRSIHDWQKCNGGGVQSVMTGAEWGRTAEHLIDVCFSKQSRDNMSVILVAFPASWTKGGDVHPSAQYLMTWSCKDVQKWLACNNFTEYQEDFGKFEVDGKALLDLSEDDLVKDLQLKKVGLRKRLWQRVDPLRLGYVGWSTEECIKWLSLCELSALEDVLRRHDIDGRGLASAAGQPLADLAHEAGVSSQVCQRLHHCRQELDGSRGKLMVEAVALNAEELPFSITECVSIPAVNPLSTIFHFAQHPHTSADDAPLAATTAPKLLVEQTKDPAASAASRCIVS